MTKAFPVILAILYISFLVFIMALESKVADKCLHGDESACVGAFKGGVR